MSKLLNISQTGNLGFKNLSEQRKEIVRKWNESGLLDNIGYRGNKINIAKLFESEASRLIQSPFNLSYHTERFNQESLKKNLDGMEFHIMNIIRLTTNKIMKDHCG